MGMIKKVKKSKATLESVNRNLERLAVSVAKGFSGVDEKFTEVDKKFTKIDERFDKLHAKIDERFERLKIKLTELEILLSSTTVSELGNSKKVCRKQKSLWA